MAAPLRSPVTGRFIATPRSRGIRNTKHYDAKRSEFTRIKVLGVELSYRMPMEAWGQLSAVIKDVQKRSSKLTVPFQQFQQVWFEQNYRIFTSEGIPPWAPLNEDYAKWKNTMGFDQEGRPILQLTGRLARSLTSETPDTIYHAKPKSLQFGTAVEYSSILQDGTDNMPARPHDILLPETFDVLVNMVGQYIELPLEETLA